MPYRRCGQSGLLLPAISLGAWETFGGYRGEEVARECIFRAFDLGITHFDLANNYGQPAGNAETVCGRVIKEMPRDELIVSTKAGYRMWPGPYGEMGGKKYMVASLDQSLKRLQLDYVDIFYSHRPDTQTPFEETLGTLDQIVRQGKALYVGISSYSGAQFKECAALIERNGWSRIVIHQPCYNLLERKIETDLLIHTEHHGCGVIAFCPLAQGLLTDKYLNGVPADSRAALVWDENQRKRKLSEKFISRIRALNALAKERGQSLAQMALCWTLRDPRVTSALIGASKIAQIEENIAALSTMTFSAVELAKIDEITPAAQT